MHERWYANLKQSLPVIQFVVDDTAPVLWFLVCYGLKAYSCKENHTISKQ